MFERILYLYIREPRLGVYWQPRRKPRVHTPQKPASLGPCAKVSPQKRQDVRTLISSSRGRLPSSVSTPTFLRRARFPSASTVSAAVILCY